MGIDLSIIWFVIIVFATLMYIVMDGFDLGIGILFPATPDADDRDVMVNSVAPVWDGNETWLVLGGAALFGAFPLAYAVIIDALTIPLTLMLIGLIFRGVAFEFRFKATPAHRPFWDKAFIGGSILATFTQGMTVGAVINGFSVTGRAYSGGPFDWLTVFNLFCGAGLVVAYALLGSTWLVMKSENALQQRMRRVSITLLILKNIKGRSCERPFIFPGWQTARFHRLHHRVASASAGWNPALCRTRCEAWLSGSVSAVICRTPGCCFAHAHNARTASVM